MTNVYYLISRSSKRIFKLKIGKWSVSKYTWWDFKMNKWQVPVCQSGPPPEMFVMIKGAQFSLVSKRTTVVESFSLVQKPKATRVYVKSTSMAVITKCGEKYRKFKILFDSREDAEEASQILRKYVKIVIGGDKSSSSGSREAQIPNRNTLAHILEQLISSPDPQIPAPDSIPEDYPLESAVRLCILDPGFPSLVHRVEAIINNDFK